MGARVVAFDLLQGRLFVGGVEDLAKLLKPSPTISEGGNWGASIDQGISGAPALDVTNLNGERKSVRAFARGFADRKLYERIAVLLHYAHRIEHRATLTARDLRDWFGLCGFKLPVRMDKAM